jgi:general secretion pathway protein L
VATRAAGGERAIERTRARLALLDEFRSRAHADLNALQELTRLLPPPGWLQNMQMTRGAIVIQGEAEQAAALLKLIDGSPYFRDSEFTQPISRTAAGESFGIRANREGGRP